MKTTIEMAREAGGADITSHGFTAWIGTQTPEFLERFAELVRADERDRIADEAKAIIKRAEKRGAEAAFEECASIADSMDPCQDGAIGQAIRARGKTK